MSHPTKRQKRKEIYSDLDRKGKAAIECRTKETAKHRQKTFERVGKLV
jgi:hypothetical protein